MRAVLGIDAAWTDTQPSGVALVVHTPRGWCLKAAESSYQRFRSLADNSLRAEHRPSGSRPDTHALLTAASALCRGQVDLIAIDIPLAYSPIVGRRCSDNVISKAYGARNCGTHTPNPSRPGHISDDLRQGFEQEGYPLRTVTVAPPGLIEVYPHPALVELANAPERLQYKAAKVRSYWPSDTKIQRRNRLFQEWKRIATLLDKEIAGVSLPNLKADAFEWQIKAEEDILDAVICCWVAVRALQGRAMPYGDENSAIWVPTPQ